MAQIDPDDDNLDRFVVWHYHFVEKQGERKLEAICAFSTRSEAEEEFRSSSDKLIKRQAAGLSDPREYFTLTYRRPGYKIDARNSRLVVRKMRSGWIAQGLTKRQTRGKPDAQSEG
jgi:hypothetical protein